MSFVPFPTPAPAALALVAATPAGGFALVNGTPTILSWAVPNDGQIHTIHMVGNLQVTSLETGGLTNLNFSRVDGSGAATTALYTAGQAAGSYAANQDRLVAAGSTVTITQGSALTGGAAALWAQIWGN